MAAANRQKELLTHISELNQQIKVNPNSVPVAFERLPLLKYLISIIGVTGFCALLASFADGKEGGFFSEENRARLRSRQWALVDIDRRVSHIFNPGETNGIRSARNRQWLSYTGGDNRLYIFDVNSLLEIPVSREGWNVTNPSFSPNNESLAFAQFSPEQAQGELVIFNLATKDSKIVTDSIESGVSSLAMIGDRYIVLSYSIPMGSIDEGQYHIFDLEGENWLATFHEMLSLYSF